MAIQTWDVLEHQIEPRKEPPPGILQLKQRGHRTNTEY